MSADRPRVLMAAPPFFSHFRPMRSLGRALAERGADVIVATDASFRDEVESVGLTFRSLRLNRNANRGTARLTHQGDEEHRRLEEFLEATRRGAVDALIVQSRHRRADMLPDPDGLADDLEALSGEESPDLWVVDQLSYGATLALRGMGAPFATFCAPHPSAIPEAGRRYGVPRSWPSSIAVDPPALEELRDAAENTARFFTREFNRILTGRYRADPVDDAFRVCSGDAVVYNYPDLGTEATVPTGPRRLFAGHFVEPQALPPEWWDWARGDGPAYLIVLGTFLASRTDVLEALIRGVSRRHPDARIAVGAGDGVDALKDLVRPGLRIEPFVPQRALLPHVDAVFHHGGVSSFTETLHAGRPAVVLPFSSDQFDVASDVERRSLGAVLNPNSLVPEDVARALDHLESPTIRRSVAEVSDGMKRRGPDWAAGELIESFEEAR